jgi:hypothetical protein
MFSFENPGERGPRGIGGISRREWLRVGSLGAAGLTLPQLLAAQAQAATTGGEAKPAPKLAAGLGGGTFGRAKSVIFLWLQGGPPQHETFDPKPEAPVEIRGPFQSIKTNVPGIDFCELLPRTARIADKLAICRSLYTSDNNHDVSGYWILTGYPYGPGSARQIKPTDWPYFGSIVKMMKPSEKLPALTSVWVPDMMRLNEGVTPAGQTAGFLGGRWEPERFVGDPAQKSYSVQGLSLPGDVTQVRIDRRRDLLKQIDRGFAEFERSTAVDSWNKLSQQAYDLVTSGKAKTAFDLSQEKDAVRERYGRHSWGQTVLMARRLVEAGVRLVHVNWPREVGDSAVDNPVWDTHSKNADRLQDLLCPQFDVGFTALIEDLEQRGLLDETLVVAIGEFGRTPKINKAGGRDHWGHVFGFALAGAGIRGGQVFGASDKNGAYPTVDPIRPHDLTATIFHLLGVDPAGMFHDLNDRPHPITKGEPLARLIGNGPATTERREAGGDIAFVPPFDDRLLFDTDFRANLPLVPASNASRDKGWRAKPIRNDADPAELAVKKIDAAAAGTIAPHVRIGFTPCDDPAAAAQPVGARAVFAQEIRNARSGSFTFTVKVTGCAPSAEVFQQAFAGAISCRLVLFRFKTMAKDPTDIDELGSETFTPTFDEKGAAQEFKISKFLGSTQPNVNFPIGNGLGVGVVVERIAASTPIANLAAVAGSHEVYLRIDSAVVEFNPRPRDETVVT